MKLVCKGEMYGRQRLTSASVAIASISISTPAVVRARRVAALSRRVATVSITRAFVNLEWFCIL